MRYKIDEIVQLIMDYRGKTPKKLGMNWTESQKDIIALSAKNIKDNKIVNTDKSHYGSELLYKHWMKDGDIEPGDILMTSEAPLGEVYLVSKPIKAILSQRLFLLRFNKKIVNPWYMYAFMNSQSFKNQLLLRATGTTVVGIKQKDLRKIEVELPNRELQNKIGSIFQFLYKKILINGRINDNLTNQIKYTSNNYFQFFKNHSCKNWTYVKLEDIAKISSGYSYQGNELLPSNTAMATIKNFNRTGGFNTNGFKEIKPKKNVKLEKYVNLFDVLVAHTDITQNGDIIGNAEVVLDTVKYKKIIYSMDLVKVTPKNHLISPFLLALLLQGNELKKYCLRYVNGTTVLHLNKKAIKKFEIPIPNNISDINNIEKYARYAYKNMSINLKENRILKSLKTEILNKYF